MSGSAPQVPYREITESHYATTAAVAFVIEEYATGMWLLRGPCPRCAAVIDIPVVSEVVKGADRTALGPSPDRAQEPGAPASEEGPSEAVICTCDEAHEGRPDGRVGCGAYWNFVL